MYRRSSSTSPTLLLLLPLLALGAPACGDDSGHTPPDYSPLYVVPALTDWACPTGWQSVPGFTDENGAEDVPEGLTQFNRCAPPASWDGPSGPARLQSWTCPAGWHGVSHDTIEDEDGDPYTWCEPPLVARIFAPEDATGTGDYLSPIPEGSAPGDYQQCDVSQGLMPELWGTGCVHIGDECPVGTFPTIPATVTGNRLYVLAGSQNGDGSEGAPLGSIRDAIVAATAGDVIVVGAGTYPENMVVDKALTIWGACVEQVKVADASTIPSSTTAAIVVRAPLLVKNLELSSTGVGILQTGTGDVDVLQAEGLFLHHTTGRGVLVLTGRATIRDSLVFHIDPDAAGQARGLMAGNTSYQTPLLQVDRVVLEQVTRGLFSYGAGAVIEAADVFVRATAPDGTDLPVGPGFSVSSRGELRAERIQAELCDAHGARATSNGILTLTDAFIANTQPSTQSSVPVAYCRALEATGSAQVTLRRAAFRNNQHMNVALYQSGTAATLEDFVAYDTRPHSDDLPWGMALYATDGAEAILSRTLVFRNSVDSIRIYNGASLTAADLVSVDNLSNAEPEVAGRGLTALDGADVSIERGLFSGNEGFGFVLGESSTASLADSVIRDTQPSTTGERGVGFQAEGGATGTMTRIAIDHNSLAGIMLLDSALEATDVVVARTQPTAAEGYGGIGIASVGASTVTLQRVALSDNHWAGIVSQGEEGDQPGSFVHLQATNVLVTDTTPDASDLEGGHGILVVRGRRANLANVVIRRSHAAGLSVYADSELQADNLVISKVEPSAMVDAPGRYGWGLHVGTNTSFSGERVLVEQCRDSGVVFENALPSSLTDVVIRGTTLGECAQYDPGDPDYCLADGEEAVSRGLALVGPNDVELTYFELSDNGTMGAQVLTGVDSDGEPYAEGGTLRLTSGGVLDHQAGVCVEGQPEYDETTLQGAVQWDNTVDIAYTDHPGPLK